MNVVCDRAMRNSVRVAVTRLAGPCDPLGSGADEDGGVVAPDEVGLLDPLLQAAASAAAATSNTMV